MVTTGLVLAPEYREFFCYELFRRGSSEIPVVVGAIPDRGDISLDCFQVFVVAECPVYGLLPGYVSAQMLLIACDGLHLV